jgi:hypothetical protein
VQVATTANVFWLQLRWVTASNGTFVSRIPLQHIASGLTVLAEHMKKAKYVAFNGATGDIVFTPNPQSTVERFEAHLRQIETLVNALRITQPVVVDNVTTLPWKSVGKDRCTAVVALANDSRDHLRRFLSQVLAHSSSVLHIDDDAKQDVTLTLTQPGASLMQADQNALSVAFELWRRCERSAPA